MAMGNVALAKDGETIKKGVFAENIDLSDMTEAEAQEAINAYVSNLNDVEITLVCADNNEETVTAAEIGIYAKTEGLIKEAMSLGTKGNIIERYKAIKDLEYENKVYPIEIGFDKELIREFIETKCTKYDQKAINVTLKRENGAFVAVDGQTGYKLDVDGSTIVVEDYLSGDWDRQPCKISLNVIVDEPAGSAADLAEITDVLGSFTTSYTTSGSSRSANVANGCSLVNGITLYPGEEFSMYESVSPFSEANGYYMAGSYLNGKVVDSLGGGICQVSTTLYNAVLLAELEVTERYNHSMIVSYVDPSADAAIAESSGKDFKFVNNTDYPIYIEGYTNNKHITFNIYGKETRPSSHKVKYESEVLEVNKPESDLIYADGSQPIGYIVTESAHIGYKARLWKIVYEDGKEVSREIINSSNYKMVPRSATVGTATADPTAAAEINAAIGTASIDHVKNVIAAISARAAEPQAPEEAPAE